MFLYLSLLSLASFVILTIAIRLFNGPKNFFNFIFILELLFLTINLILNYFTILFGLQFGSLFGMVILFVSGCEVVIGIGILVGYYRVSGKALTMFIKQLKG